MRKAVIFLLRICKNKDCASPYFNPHFKVPNQQFCSNPECQKARRRIWQNKKRFNDKDYKKNQAAAQKAWAKNNPDYWKKYRDNNPHYTERNRKLQKIRNLRSNNQLKQPTFNIDKIAKMDGYMGKNVLISGYYNLYPIHNDGFAKMNGMIVKIEIITRG
jgi:hypothetical protein